MAGVPANASAPSKIDTSWLNKKPEPKVNDKPIPKQIEKINLDIKKAEPRKSDLDALPGAAAAGSGGNQNDFKRSLEAMLARGRPARAETHAKPAAKQDTTEVYKISMYDVPPEER